MAMEASNGKFVTGRQVDADDTLLIKSRVAVA